MKRIQIFLGVFLVASSAFADADPINQALFNAGVAKQASGDHVGALADFQKVYDNTKRAPALLAIGTELKNLGRFAEAADAYERYLADPQMKPSKKAETLEALQLVLTHVGTVHIDADAGARLTVDAKEAKTTARVDAGPHVIVAEDGKDPPLTAQVTVAAGEEQSVSLHRQPDRAAASDAPQTGGRPPPTAVMSPDGHTTLAYVLGGVGIVGLGIGTVFGVQALSKHSDFKSNPTQATYDAGTRDGVLADVGLGVGVVGMFAATYLLLTSPGDMQAGFVIAPAVGPGRGGVAVRSVW